MLKFAISCFLISYVSAGSMPCTRLYMGSTGQGTVAHLNYPFNYTERLRCEHHIYIPEFPSSQNWSICFEFRRFSLTDSPVCSDDYLSIPGYIYCGDGEDHVRAGQSKANVFTTNLCWPVTSGEIFVVTFSSRSDSTNRGFLADFTLIDEPVTSLVPAPMTQCEKSEWRCMSGECVKRTSLCDGVYDCSDRSDESAAHAECSRPNNENIEACTFEDGMCGLKLSGWLRSKSLTSEPFADNTYKEISKGTFLSSDYTSTSEITATYTIPVNSTTWITNVDHCLSFNYYMNVYVGTLMVRINGSSGSTGVAWIRRGIQAMSWLQGEVSVPASLFPIREISFVVRNSPDTLRSIHLDDISLLPGSCFRDDISCTFDVDLCTWRMHNSARGNFERRKGQTQTPKTGPSSDHTTNTGHYIYLEASDYLEFQSARLVSKPVSNPYSGVFCFSFWYHMYGVMGMGSLRVYVVKKSGAVTRLWSVTGDQQDRWQYAAIGISSIEGPFQLLLEAERGATETSDIAVDDIQLNTGYCSKEKSGLLPTLQDLNPDAGKTDNLPPALILPMPKNPPPPYYPSPPNSRRISCNWGGRFKCFRGGTDYTCLPGSKLCDGVEDCSDGADESNCSPRTGGELRNAGAGAIPPSTVIGASVGGMACFAVLFVCFFIVMKVRGQQIIRAVMLYRRRYQSGHQTRSLDDETMTDGPPPYIRQTIAAPLYWLPPYESLEGGAKPADKPPEYDQCSEEPEHDDKEHHLSEQCLLPAYTRSNDVDTSERGAVFDAPGAQARGFCPSTGI